jgi:hypothetical protein
MHPDSGHIDGAPPSVLSSVPPSVPDPAAAPVIVSDALAQAEAIVVTSRNRGAAVEVAASRMSEQARADVAAERSAHVEALAAGRAEHGARGHYPNGGAAVAESMTEHVPDRDKESQP